MKNIKHILFIALLLSSSLFVSAQQIANLEGINYQAVAIDHEGKEIVGVDINGEPLYEREIGVRFTISAGQDGTVYYQDTHSTITDKYGLFTLVIGKGNVTDGISLMDIPWINGDQWLKVEIAIHNDGNYKLVSNQQFMAVPYSFYTDDIADDAITTAKILNEEILSEDINNETILAEDINTGAVETSEILDETILAEDIGTGSVETSEILNETIIAEDIATSAVETSELMDGTILNEDIANGTIDLSAKIADVAPRQILIGDENASGVPKLKELKAGTGIAIDQDNTTVTVSYTLGQGGVTSDGLIDLSILGVGTGNADVSSEVLDISTFGKSAVAGDLVLASINQPLQNCILTTFVSGSDQVTVSIYNPENSAKTFTAPLRVKLLIIK